MREILQVENPGVCIFSDASNLVGSLATNGPLEVVTLGLAHAGAQVILSVDSQSRVTCDE